MEVTIQIPDGEYCNGCKFLNYYTHELVNMFGDPTGNLERGYECKYHGTKLEVEDHDCYCNVKKCFACGGSQEDKFMWLLLTIMTFGGEKLQKELEKYAGNESRERKVDCSTLDDVGSDKAGTCE